MAMRTASPIGFTVALLFGLAFIFLGLRALAHIEEFHLGGALLGGAIVFAVTLLRVWTFMATSGARKRRKS